MKERRFPVTTIAIAGLFTSLILLATSFLKLPLPSGWGYVHLGDVFIFLACYYLKPQISPIVAGVGSMFADLIAGFPMYMPITLVVKALMALTAALIMYKKPVLWRLIVGNIAGGIIMLLGYFLYEGFAFGWGVAVGNLPLSSIQPAVGVVLSVLIILPLKKVKYLENIRGK